jgi:hypothetical protein
MSKSSSAGLTPAGGKRRTRTLRVVVDEDAAAAAAGLAREYAGESLGKVLAGLVCDMAQAAQRPGCWEAERVESWLGSHVWECERKDRPCQ